MLLQLRALCAQTPRPQMLPPPPRLGAHGSDPLGRPSIERPQAFGFWGEIPSREALEKTIDTEARCLAGDWVTNIGTRYTILCDGDSAPRYVEMELPTKILTGIFARAGDWWEAEIKDEAARPPSATAGAVAPSATFSVVCLPSSVIVGGRCCHRHRARRRPRSVVGRQVRRSVLCRRWLAFVVGRRRWSSVVSPLGDSCHVVH